MPRRYTFHMTPITGVFGMTYREAGDPRFAQLDAVQIALEKRLGDPDWTEQLVGLVDLDDSGTPE